MKSNSILLTTAICSSIALTTPALAQGLGINAGVEVGVDVNISGGSNPDDSGSVEAGSEAGGEAGLGVGITLGADGDAGGADGEGGDAPANPDGATDAQADMLIALIVDTEWQGDEFAGEISIDGAQAYSVAGWIRGEAEVRYRAAVAESQEQIQMLRTAIAANAELTAWLQANGHDVSSVVAVGVDAEGRLVVFTE